MSSSGIADLRVVALGGGHGLAATLSALRSHTTQITAVVTVADNGGSSGRLRAEFPIFPPGDLRMALAALCSSDEWGRSWAEIVQYRFSGDGPLGGHAVGNLILAALWDKDSDPVKGLDRVAALLKIVGRVLPMATVPLDIEALIETKEGLVTAHGQESVALTRGNLKSLRIIPENPSSHPETIEAIMKADWITMGPGSWFSSVLPHLLVPAQRDAIAQSKAKKLLILNLDAHSDSTTDEFGGYSALEHLEIVQRFAPDILFTYVIADPTVMEENTNLIDAVSRQGGELLVADVISGASQPAHSPEKLGDLFAHIYSQNLVG